MGFDDGVFGPLETDAAEIEDLVIARGDGSALYNMVVVADDRSMAITHVVRGADHTSNTFRQILLYRALGWEPPRFAHLPLLPNMRRRKLSKRDGSQWLGEYRAQGYLPEAVVNFMVFLGWSPGYERELFSLDELVAEFSLARVNRADAVYDAQRLDHFNGVWLRRFDMDTLAERALPYARDGGLAVDDTQRKYFQQALALEQERISHLSDVPDMMGFFFDDDLDPDVELMRFKRHDRAETAAALTTVAALARELPDFSVGAIEVMLQGAGGAARLEDGRPVHAHTDRRHGAARHAAAVRNHGGARSRAVPGPPGARAGQAQRVAPGREPAALPAGAVAKAGAHGHLGGARRRAGARTGSDGGAGSPGWGDAAHGGHRERLHAGASPATRLRQRAHGAHLRRPHRGGVFGRGAVR